MLLFKKWTTSVCADMENVLIYYGVKKANCSTVCWVRYHFWGWGNSLSPTELSLPNSSIFVWAQNSLEGYTLDNSGCEGMWAMRRKTWSFAFCKPLLNVDSLVFIDTVSSLDSRKNLKRKFHGLERIGGEEINAAAWDFQQRSMLPSLQLALALRAFVSL